MPAESRGLSSVAETTSSRFGRRPLLKGAAALGLASPAFGGALVPSARRTARAQSDPQTLTIPGSPNDLDPHSQYDYNSVVAIRGPY
jgi:nitrous oxide reductase